MELLEVLNVEETEVATFEIKLDMEFPRDRDFCF